MTGNNTSDIILYSSPDGNVRVEVIYSGETFWLTQKRMSELFGVEVPAISKHLANIYESGELLENSTISILETVQKEEAILGYQKSLAFAGDFYFLVFL